MPTYYVWSPDFPQVRAEVEAPDTRYARTTYLDYLHRGDMISYSQRQSLRDRIMTKRIRPGEMAGETDIVLDYDMRVNGTVNPYAQTLSEWAPDVKAPYTGMKTPGAAPNQGLSVLPTPRPSEVNPQPGNMQSLTPGAGRAVGRSLKSLIAPAGGMEAEQATPGQLMLPAPSMKRMMPVGRRPASPVPGNAPDEGETDPTVRRY